MTHVHSRSAEFEPNVPGRATGRGGYGSLTPPNFHVPDLAPQPHLRTQISWARCPPVSCRARAAGAALRLPVAGFGMADDADRCRLRQLTQAPGGTAAAPVVWDAALSGSRTMLDAAGAGRPRIARHQHSFSLQCSYDWYRVGGSVVSPFTIGPSMYAPVDTVWLSSHARHECFALQFFEQHFIFDWMWGVEGVRGGPPVHPRKSL